MTWCPILEQTQRAGKIDNPALSYLSTFSDLQRPNNFHLCFTRFTHKITYITTEALTAVADLWIGKPANERSS
jgi:hypothetical protein